MLKIAIVAQFAIKIMANQFGDKPEKNNHPFYQVVEHVLLFGNFIGLLYRHYPAMRIGFAAIAYICKFFFQPVRCFPFFQRR